MDNLMNTNRRFLSLFLTLPLLLSLLALPLVARGEPGSGYTGVQSISALRIVRETFYATPAPTTTGNGDILDYSFSGSEVSGDVISASSVNPPNGPRTFAVKFVEASGSAARIKVTITGKNQFGGPATESFDFTSSGTLTGKIAFAPRPEPVVTLTTSTSDAASDTLDIYSAGWGLYSDPRSTDDIISEQCDGATTTTLSANYNTAFSTYFNTSVPTSKRVDIDVKTSSIRELPVGRVNFTYAQSE